MNLAITQELPQRNWNIRRKPGVYALGFYWLTEIQSDSLLYGRENEEIPNQHVLLWLKDCLTLKNALENSLNCAHYNKRHK